MYQRRAGSQGLNGQLYETKLLSLILFRAQHDHNIEEFCLGSNLENAGHFDDICFKAKIKGHDRPLVVFLQVKHRSNDKILTFNRIDIVKYFKSYLEVKQSFNPQSKDIFFNEYFDNTECVWIFYTNAKGDFNRDVLNSPFSNHLHDLIATGIVEGSQLCYTEEDVQLLETELLTHEIKILAKHFAKFIITERYQMMMNDEYILRYHIILARNVVHVSRVAKEHSVCTFRHNFFDTTDKYLLLFKEEFCQNVFELLQSKHNTVQESHIKEFLCDPSERTLINVIGSIITYKNNKLKFINDMPDNLKRQLSVINLPHSTINKAIKTVTINKLQSLTFEVPVIFGNTDLVIVGNTKRVERRIDFLADNIVNMIKTSKPSGIVSIDETMQDGLLRLNGGLAGAVGNLLVYDDESGLLKFTDNCSLLERNAKYLLTKIRGQIDDLQKYRLEVNIKKFPKLKICDRYNKHLVKNFLSKLMFFTDQASHEVVEKILKEEIENHQSYSKTASFRIKSDAIFLKYHDNILKWWTSPNPYYLTKETNTYQVTVNNIISFPLIRITSMMYMTKITTSEYYFNENALELFAEHFSKTIQTILVTNITILTVIKVIQCLRKLEIYEPVVLDLKYILKMLTDEFYALISELKKRDMKDILVLICDDLRSSLNSNIKLQKFIQAISGEVVIITNNTDTPMIKQYFPQISNVLLDEKHSMEDLGPTSQSKILNNAKVSFQGENVTLACLVDDLPMKLIEGSVLRKVILNENIVIAGSLTSLNYDKMQHLFVDRKVIRDHVSLELRTLADIKDDIVLVTGKPGMGKSTLLTHLAVKTKKVDHTLWIVKINFLDCVKYFNKWQKHRTVISRLEMLKFMCQIVLQTIRPGCNATISLNIESNREVFLLDLSGDDEWATFELRLFLHFYMKTKVIFLFDGFDEISPHYTETVMDFLNTVKDDCCKNKMWITSRLCKDVDSLIESRFGTPYELECFDENELNMFLDKFWKTNLILSNFDKEQIEAVKEFLDKTLAENATTIFNYSLGCVYESLILYLVTNFPDLDGRDRWRDLYDTITHSLKHMPLPEAESSASSINRCVVETPLLAYLTAKYFADHIKNLDDKTYETFSKICPMTIYEQFVKTKLLKHFIYNKKLDIYNPSIRMEYEEEFENLMKLYNN